MGEYFFNIDHGYLEGLVRGFKEGILTQTDYANLVQCETLEGDFLYEVIEIFENSVDWSKVTSVSFV